MSGTDAANLDRRSQGRNAFFKKDIMEIQAEFSELAEIDDIPTILAQAETTKPEMVLLDWD